jgi:RNA polymerase sigma-70 factor (ECF subfamily)
MLGDGPRAHDVAQDTFLRFLSARVEGGEGGVVAWLYRTSANLAIDALRVRGRHVELALAPPAGAPEVSESGAALRATLARLAKSVAPEVLQAGLLSRADGLTHLELAEVLQVSERTVRRWLTAFDEAAERCAEEMAP